MMLNFFRIIIIFLDVCMSTKLAFQVPANIEGYRESRLSSVENTEVT